MKDKNWWIPLLVTAATKIAELIRRRRRGK